MRAHRKTLKPGRNLRAVLSDILQETVTVRDGDRQIRVARQQAIVRALADRAVKDPRIAISLLGLARNFGVATDEGDQAALSAIDPSILDEFIDQEIVKRNPAAPSSEESDE